MCIPWVKLPCWWLLVVGVGCWCCCHVVIGTRGMKWSWLFLVSCLKLFFCLSQPWPSHSFSICMLCWFQLPVCPHHNSLTLHSLTCSLTSLLIHSLTPGGEKHVHCGAEKSRQVSGEDDDPHAESDWAREGVWVQEHHVHSGRSAQSERSQGCGMWVTEWVTEWCWYRKWSEVKWSEVLTIG